MKKIIPLLLIGVLLISGLGAALAANTVQTPLQKTQTLSFSTPTIQIKEGRTSIIIPNTNTWQRTTGMPMLPVQTTTYTFPFGTKIRTVDVTFSASQTITLPAPITLASAPVSQAADSLITYTPEQQTIPPTYPAAPFEYYQGAGMTANEQHVIYLTIRCYPVQYKTAEQQLLYRDNAHIKITYDLPTNQPTPTDDFKLLIIAPKDFATALQPLVDHKTSHGVTTKLVTLDDITASTFFPVQGRDSAEQVKYFIKNAFDQWGTKYVLLAGGRHGGITTEKWWVPVRYTHLDDGANWEGTFLTDLYFADLYDAGGNFSSWDSNHNDVFGEWAGTKKDIIDFYPDLSVGRLAFKSASEIKTVVDKIITYETTTAGTQWFKKIVGVGGDSAPMADDPWYEGEEENKLAFEYMTGFETIKLWTSTTNFTSPQDVVDAINAGAGFVYFDGHGNPVTWSTHPPHNESIWIDGLLVKNMKDLTNGAQLPVVVCGGCHNGQFNTSLGMLFKGILKEKFKYFQWTYWLNEWAPECWAWKLVSMKNGGSVATIANTALDWFSESDSNHDGIPDAVQFLQGYINTQFFKNYGVNNMTVLGKTHTQALTDYLNAFPPMQDKLDCKTVQEWTLLGDPSLQIGGYS
jgi:hypothetical protein